MRKLVRYYNCFKGELKINTHIQAIKNTEMNLQVHEKLIDIHRDINCIPLDKIYLNFYVQESFALPHFPYNLHSCKLAQRQ